jgi:AraC family transcriptional regulator, melibiose operon regulatory protein
MAITIFDPERPSFSPYGFTCLRWQPSRTTRPDRHNEVELNLLESGSLTYLIGGRRIRLEAGRLNVFWAAMPHQILDQQDAKNFLVATIPLAWVFAWRLPEPLMQPLMQGKVLRSGEPQYAAEDLQMLTRWIEYMEHSPRLLQQIILLEIQARLLRFALSDPAASPETSYKQFSARNRLNMNKAEQLAGFVAQHCTEKLGAEDMGRAVNLHPNYAMAVFKSTFGITLNEFLTQQRISHAQRLLATTDSKITEIALNSGFGSVSRFNAAFQAACTCSPSAFRQRNRIG